MNIPMNELTPERCRELRQNGTLKVMINLYHAPTAEPNGQSEADFNPEQFLQNFNQHADLQRRLGDRIRRIIQTTAENRSEAAILSSMEVIRHHFDWFYGALITGNEDIVIAGVPDILQEAVVFLGNIVNDPITRPFVEQFGGFTVILDLIRAQTRLYVSNREFGEFQSHNRLLKNALNALNNLVMTQPLPHEEICRKLGKCRSFHEHLVTIIRRAHRDNELGIVQVCCNLISVMFTAVADPLTFYPDGYMVSCGVVRCVAELLPQTDDPLTRRVMLDSLTLSMEHDGRNIMEFCSTDGSIGAIADILAPNYANNADEENAPNFQQHREAVIRMFSRFVFYLAHRTQIHNDYRLLRILVERDIAVVLFPHIDEQHECLETEPGTEATTEQLDDPVYCQQHFVGGLFKAILLLSDDQVQKIEQLRQRQD